MTTNNETNTATAAIPAKLVNPGNVVYHTGVWHTIETAEESANKIVWTTTDGSTLPPISPDTLIERRDSITPTARIENVGKRKYIPALVVTLPDGTVETSKGNRAVKAHYVAIRREREDGHMFHTSHARWDLAMSWDPLGKGQDTVNRIWELVEVIQVERPAE